MSNYRIEQRRLTHRGREFHFVSYEGRPADARKDAPAEPAMWYLMAEGKRRAVMPQQLGQDLADLDRQLVRWLDEHVFAVGREASGSGR